MRIRAFIVAILIISFGSSKIAYTQTFCIYFAGMGNEYAYDIFTEDHNSFVVAGSTDSYGAGSLDLYVTKYNALGNIQWSRTVGGFGNEVGYGIDMTTDGDYVIAGETNTLGSGSGEVYVVRLDANGNLLWTIAVGGDQFDHGHEIAATSDNGCAIIGTTGSYGQGFDDAYVIKLDSNGTVQWAQT